MNEYDFKSSKAFVTTFNIKPYQSGILDGLTFAVKDNIDISKYKTSYGNISWLESHPPAVYHALCVEQLLVAGATCVGKTVADEFTYSLDGESYFYDTPINPKAPDRIPGGSSSGSASAVACGLVDFSIGTDCAGSIRVPASLCGVLGMRPTTHRISEAGVLPFVPSVSTIGVFAKEITVLESVMQVLLKSNKPVTQPLKNIYLLTDAFSLCDIEVKLALEESIFYLNSKNIQVSKITMSEIMGEEFNLNSCNERALRVLQSAEVANTLCSWIEANQPELGPNFQAGFENVKKLDRTTVNEALFLCEKIFNKITEFIKDGDIICFPTVPVLAPLKGELDHLDKIIDYYDRTMATTSFAGLGQLPEISIPVAHVKNIPIGLSFVAGHRQDEFLMDAIKKLFEEYQTL